MADSKKIRVDARFRVRRNSTDVVREALDFGEIDFTEATWNEVSVANGSWVQLPFSHGMTAFKHMVIIADQDIELGWNASPVAWADGKFHMSTSETNTHTGTPYVRFVGAGSVNIRYGLVN